VSSFKANCALAPHDELVVSDKASERLLVATVFDNGRGADASVALSHEDALRLYGWLAEWLKKPFD
jgi:hypothetical protein